MGGKANARGEKASGDQLFHSLGDTAGSRLQPLQKRGEQMGALARSRRKRGRKAELRGPGEKGTKSWSTRGGGKETLDGRKGDLTRTGISTKKREKGILWRGEKKKNQYSHGRAARRMRQSSCCFLGKKTAKLHANVKSGRREKGGNTRIIKKKGTFAILF